MSEELEMNEWISIERRLPENGKNVIVLHRGIVREARIAWTPEFRGQDSPEWLTREGMWLSLKQVTGWMPKPTPPAQPTPSQPTGEPK
jgi:hypothetical protein